MNFPEPTIAALLGLAVGDAFGCPFEFHEGAPDLARKSMAEGRYLRGYEDCRLPVRRCRTPGLGSDDTQQSLVLLWVWGQMADRGKDPLRADVVAELFLRVCRRMAEERVPRGAGSFGVHRGTGRNFRECILKGEPPDTGGLGAAMRIGPAATLLPRPRLVVPWAVRVSEATTTDPVALAGAARFAAAAWDMAHGRTEIGDEAFGVGDVSAEVRDAWDLLARAEDVFGAEGEEALLDFAARTGLMTKELRCAADGAALTGVPWVLQIARSVSLPLFGDSMVAACASGGDTDTVCAMVGCLSALRFGRETVPPWMLDGLVGREHLDDPILWHPVRTERLYVEMDLDLQARIEGKLREEARTKKAVQTAGEG